MTSPATDEEPVDRDIRELYLETAAVVVDAIAEPEVGANWDDPSSLAGLTIGALAAHAARALSTVHGYLAGEAPVAGARPVDAPGYVLAVQPDDEQRRTEVDAGVRQRAITGAEGGHDVLVRRATDHLRALRVTLPHLRPTHILDVLDGVTMLVDRYLETRIVELVVHHDDLDASLPGVPRRPLPDEAGEVAVRVLAEVARRRTSTTAMVSLLARRERLAEARPPRAL